MTAIHPGPYHTLRVRASDWAVGHLQQLATDKAFSLGTLARIAIDLGTADLIAHYKALESVTPAGLDTSDLSNVLPGVDVVARQREAIKLRNKEAKKGG